MTTLVNYPTDVKNGPMLSDAEPFYSTLAEIAAAAVAAGKTLAVTRDWTALPTQTIACDIQFTGGSFQPAAGHTISITGAVTCPLEQKCYDASNYDGTHASFSFPNGAPSVFGPTQFGMSQSGTGTANAAAFMAAFMSLPVNPNGFLTVSGLPVRTGILQIAAGSYPFRHVLISSGITVTGVAGYSFSSGLGSMAYFVLDDGVAASGPEYWVIQIDPSSYGGNGSFGTVFRNIGINGNGGFPGYGGSNASASGLMFYGAQGSAIDNVIIQNVGLRCLWMPSTVSNSGLFGVKDMELLAAIQGPAWQIDGAVGIIAIGTTSLETINPAGIYVDGDGDPNAALLCTSCNSNSFLNLETENAYLPVKLKNSSNNYIGASSFNAPVGGAPVAILETLGSTGNRIESTFSFRTSPNLYTLFYNDVQNGVTIPGNLNDYPSAAYDQGLSTDYQYFSNILGPQTFRNIYNNGSGSYINVDWVLTHIIGSIAGGLPTFDILLLKFLGPSGLNTLGFGLAESGEATNSSGNFGSAPFFWRGSYWNGSANIQPAVQAVLNVSTGTDPYLTLAFTDGSNGLAVSVPSLQLGSVYSYATLPPARLGMQAIIGDSTVNTWGTTITTGGGTDQVLAWYNGVNWTVMGK